MQDSLARPALPPARRSPGAPGAPVTPTRRALLGGAGIGALALALSACGSSGSTGSDKPVIIVGCYGVEYMAQQVAGDSAQVHSLAKPGAEPHDIELSVSEAATVQQAAVIIQIPGFQSALDDLIESKGLADRVLDVSSVITLLPASGTGEDAADGEAEHEEEGHEEHDHGSYDPHFWNDPHLLADVATALGEKLAQSQSSIADAVRASAAETAQALDALDRELAKTFDAVSGTKTFVTGHTAFAYLAARYGLHQVGITGIDPEVEPSPQRLLSLQKLIESEKVTTVFFEESASPKVARTLASKVGVRAESLDNLETQLDPKAEYPAVMREDAAKLVASWS